MRRQPLGEIERRRPADIVREVAVHLLLECRIGLRLCIGLFEFEDQRHQRLGDEAAAIDAEMPALVRPGAEGIGALDAHPTRNSLRCRILRRAPKAHLEGCGRGVRPSPFEAAGSHLRVTDLRSTL